jgi:hypothetical protein
VREQVDGYEFAAAAEAVERLRADLAGKRCA